MLDFPDSSMPVESWTIVDFDHSEWSRLGHNDHFASRHTGYLLVDVADEYTFYLTSDSCSRMFLDMVMLIKW
ncbi:hypothetical protein DIPPA_03649 [Diplonema papillatum]|nr:hypothetical protein DIPPA_03649 [Diplonema papillatum]